MLRTSYAPTLNRSRLSGGVRWSEAFVTRCEAHEYGRRQSTLPFATRGDRSHARSTLSRLANHLGYFLPAYRSRWPRHHFQWQADGDAPFSPASRVRSHNLIAHHGQGDGRIDSHAQLDAILRLSRSCPERGRCQRAHCRPLRTGHYAPLISLHPGRPTALSGVSDLGALPCAFGTSRAPFLPAAARECSRVILRTASPFQGFRSRILSRRDSDFEDPNFALFGQSGPWSHDLRAGNPG